MQRSIFRFCFLFLNLLGNKIFSFEKRVRASKQKLREHQELFVAHDHTLHVNPFPDLNSPRTQFLTPLQKLAPSPSPDQQPAFLSSPSDHLTSIQSPKPAKSRQPFACSSNTESNLYNISPSHRKYTLELLNTGLASFWKQSTEPVASCPAVYSSSHRTIPKQCLLEVVGVFRPVRAFMRGIGFCETIEWGVGRDGDWSRC